MTCGWLTACLSLTCLQERDGPSLGQPAMEASSSPAAHAAWVAVAAKPHAARQREDMPPAGVLPPADQEHRGHAGREAACALLAHVDAEPEAAALFKGCFPGRSRSLQSSLGSPQRLLQGQQGARAASESPKRGLARVLSGAWPLAAAERPAEAGPAPAQGSVEVGMESATPAGGGATMGSREVAAAAALESDHHDGSAAGDGNGGRGTGTLAAAADELGGKACASPASKSGQAKCMADPFMPGSAAAAGPGLPGRPERTTGSDAHETTGSPRRAFFRSLLPGSLRGLIARRSHGDSVGSSANAGAAPVQPDLQQRAEGEASSSLQAADSQAPLPWAEAAPDSRLRGPTATGEGLQDQQLGRHPCEKAADSPATMADEGAEGLLWPAASEPGPADAQGLAAPQGAGGSDLVASRNKRWALQRLKSRAASRQLVSLSTTRLMHSV